MSLSKLRGQWAYLKSQPGFLKAPGRVLFRLLQWRLFCSLKRSVTIRLPDSKLTFFLPSEWHGTSKLLYIFRDKCEPDLAILNEFLGPGKVMVDVGANYGIFALSASRVVGRSGRIIAFEPAQKSFSVLQKNLELNEADNVQALRMALAEKPGKLRLYHEADPTRNSLAASGSAQEFEEVQVQTLDAALAECGSPQVDFVKIDVEGADELVCRGALGMLRTSFPPVFFECNPAAALRMGLKESGTARVLTELGYELYQYEPGELTKLDPERLAAGNVLALYPRNKQAGRTPGSGS